MCVCVTGCSKEGLRGIGCVFMMLLFLIFTFVLILVQFSRSSYGRFLHYFFLINSCPVLPLFVLKNDLGHNHNIGRKKGVSFEACVYNGKKMMFIFMPTFEVMKIFLAICHSFLSVPCVSVTFGANKRGSLISPSYDACSEHEYLSDTKVRDKCDNQFFTIELCLCRLTVNIIVIVINVTLLITLSDVQDDNTFMFFRCSVF